MTAKHTPGPWLVDFYTDTGAFDIYVGTPLATICRRGPWDHRKGVSEANARLIAAAPDLLAELRIIYERSYNPFEPDNQSEQYKRVGALIAKATGEGP